MYIVGPIIIISGIPISTKINDYYNDLKNMYIIYNPYLCIDILLVNIIWYTICKSVIKNNNIDKYNDNELYCNDIYYIFNCNYVYLILLF